MSHDSATVGSNEGTFESDGKHAYQDSATVGPNEDTFESDGKHVYEDLEEVTPRQEMTVKILVLERQLSDNYKLGDYAEAGRLQPKINKLKSNILSLPEESGELLEIAEPTLRGYFGKNKKDQGGSGEPKSPVEHGKPKKGKGGPERFHLAYLTSEPLLCDKQPIEKLELGEEKSSLVRALDESQKVVKVRDMTATADNLILTFTNRCRAIHYSGHGMRDCLAFEDGEGNALRLYSRDLEKFARADKLNDQSNLKFVCVCACHSEAAAKVFVDYGVPHVVAIRSGVQVKDAAAITFCKTLYTSLLKGDPVSTSFNLAKVHVGFENKEQEENFLLLGEGQGKQKHDVAVFDDIDDGKWENLTHQSSTQSLVPASKRVIGREIEMQQVLHYVKDGRVVVIRGEEGIGKTIVACGVANYVHRRAHDYKIDNVFYIDVGASRVKDQESLGVICSHEIRLDQQCSSNRDFVHAMKDKSCFIILDGISGCRDVGMDSELHVPRFLKELLRWCKNVKLVVVSSVPLSYYAGDCALGEREVVIGNLSPMDSALMFFLNSPRGLLKSDVESIERLAQHVVIKSLDGIPRKICAAVQHMETYPTLDGLFDYLMQQIAEIKSLNEFVSLCEQPLDNKTVTKRINNHVFSFYRHIPGADLKSMEMRYFSESELNVIVNMINDGKALGGIWDWINGVKMILSKIPRLWGYKYKLIRGIMSREDETFWEKQLLHEGSFFIRFKSTPNCLAVVVMQHGKIERYPIHVRDIDFSIRVKENDQYFYKYFNSLEQLILGLQFVRYLLVSKGKSMDKEKVFSRGL